MIDIANTILGKIIDRKHDEFKLRLKQKSLYDVEQLAHAATPVRGFAHALTTKRPAVIAEINKIKKNIVFRGTYSEQASSMVTEPKRSPYSAKLFFTYERKILS